MLKNLTLFIFCIFMFAAAANSQDKSAETENRQNSAPVKKANERPNLSAAKDAPPEPFAKSDVKTMAAQCVKFETEAGSIEMEVFPETAPESVRNFLNLAAIGAFDTTAFSRVVPGFVIQGGDLYSGDKMTVELDKRARRTIPDEPGQIKHERGILSMARSDEPNSATTSFFILVNDAPHLDDKFAAFGRVTKGMETVDAINKAPVENEKPKKPVRINKATVAPCAPNNL